MLKHKPALACVFLALLYFGLAGTAFAKAQKHALLIGISDYSTSGLSSLPGAVNDIKATSKVLQENLGFQEDNIVALLDEQATHTAVIAALKKLDKRVEPGDFVYIHYSGHGSHVPDLNGDVLDRRGDDT